MPDSSEKHKPPFPWTTTVLAAGVVLAGFLNWGTLRHDLARPRGTAVLAHDGNVLNYIDAPSNKPDTKQGTNFSISGSAWQASLYFFGLYIPQYILVFAALALFVLAALKRTGLPRPPNWVPVALGAYGCIQVMFSFYAMLSQGDLGAGLILTGLCFVGLTAAQAYKRRPSVWD